MNPLKTGMIIRDARKKLNLTQQGLANKLFVSDKAVSKWERGICFPDISVLIPLAEVLEISLYDLLKGENMKKEEVEEVLKNTIEFSDKEIKKNKKKLKYLLVIVLVLIFSFLIHYFFMSYGKTKIYNITGSGENLTNVNGIFVETNEALYLTIYDIGYLDDLEYRAMELFYKGKDNKEHLIGGTTQDYLYFLDYKGYKSNFDIDDLEYILSNMYIRFYFQDATKIEIKLDVKLDYTNNKFFVKKKASITDGNINNEHNGFQQKNTDLRDKLIEVMEKDENGDYSYTLKKGNEEVYYTYIDGFDTDSIYIGVDGKESSISIRYSSNPKKIQYTKYENEEKKYSIRKTSFNEENVCSYGECEDIDVYKELNYYLNLIVDCKIEK